MKQNSLLRLLLRLALHRPLRSPLLHHPRLLHLQRRRRPAALLPQQHRRVLVRGTHHCRLGRRRRHRHHPHVLERNGPQGDPRQARLHVPVLLHPGRVYQLLDRLRRPEAHGADYDAVAHPRGLAADSWWVFGAGHVVDEGEHPVAGKGREARGGARVVGVGSRGGADGCRASRVRCNGTVAGKEANTVSRMEEILAGIAEEEAATEGVTWREFLLPANRWRMIMVITLQIGVQFTGNTSLAYCKPPSLPPLSFLAQRNSNRMKKQSPPRSSPPSAPVPTRTSLVASSAWSRWCRASSSSCSSSRESADGGRLSVVRLAWALTWRLLPPSRRRTRRLRMGGLLRPRLLL